MDYRKTYSLKSENFQIKCTSCSQNRNSLNLDPNTTLINFNTTF